MNNLTIEQMAGRLVIGRLPELILDEQHKEALQSGHLGGITLFKENASNLEQLARVCHDIVSSSFHPPVLTVDQEGGAVQRFEHVISSLPSPMALAAAYDFSKVAAITEISCRQLKALGFNLLLAPTLDLLTNPLNPVIGTRAFSDNIDQASKIGLEVIEEIENFGLIACAKHFPGHGSTSQDSHLELAVVDKSMAELEAYDLAPFARNIKAMRSILVGHIWLPAFDSDRKPATLSSNIVTKLLRQQLKFAGLAISDDMTMHAITKAYGLGEACVMAIEAGIDLILVCGTFAQSQEGVRAIAAAIKSGRITTNRLAEIAKRMDHLFKTKPETINPDTDKEQLETRRAAVTADNITSTAFSAQAIALLRGAAPKLNPAEYVVVAPAHPRYPLQLARELGSPELRYKINPEENDIAETFAQAKASGKKILFVSFRTFINSGQELLARRLLEDSFLAEGFIHVAADTPYDLLKIPALTSLATFDPGNQAMVALSQVLLSGQINSRAISPVNLQVSLASQIKA